MSKQTLKNVDSESSLRETSGISSTKTKSDLSSSLRKNKVTLCLVAIVVAVFVITVCAALAVVVVAVKKPQDVHQATSQQMQSESDIDPTIDMATREQLRKQIADSSSSSVKRQARTAGGRYGQGMKTSCYSIRTNKTHPAAHISGQGFRWTTVEPGTVNSIPAGNGYQTSWVCANESDAFVDGGMYFNQTDQKLYVPTCGYYYVSSSIFFQSELSPSNSNSKYVRHRIYVDRNCSYADDRLLLRSYSSLAATPQDVGRTTTYIGSVVKMCAGGTISVVIPNDRYNPCCPYGRSQTTYLSAFMVAETMCQAPQSLDHPPTDEDIANASM